MMNLAPLAQALREARAVTVLTGAGVSAESGLPTFRDSQTGLWAKYRPEDLASPEAFARDPEIVWRWYAERRARADAAAPNTAHLALAEMARRVPRFTLLTQNVDGLHQRAGSPTVIELHGSLHRARCEADGLALGWGTDAVPPLCPMCDRMLRPDIVWFGESLPEAALRAAWEAAARCDLFFSVGTSGVVYPAAYLIAIAAQNGATVGTINLDVADVASQQRYAIHGRAGDILPALLQAAWPETQG